MATTATLAASWSYDRASEANLAGDAQAVVSSLEAAAALDPSFALYQRELGVWLLATGDVDRARSRLTRAADLNPADATALRGLAIAAVADGRPDLGLAPARAAVALRGIHAENQLTLAYVAMRTPNGGEEARLAVISALQPAPWLAASPDWADHFPTGQGLAFLLETADRSWDDALMASGRYDMARAWLAAMVGGQGPQVATAEPIVLVTECDLEAASTAASGLSRSAGTTIDGLMSGIMTARATEAPATDVLAMARLRWPLLSILATSDTPAASPLTDPLEDTRLYRRLAMPAPDWGPVLPTADAGHERVAPRSGGGRESGGSRQRPRHLSLDASPPTPSSANRATTRASRAG